MLKLRAGWLGLLVVLLVGLYASASAYAVGPFWHHRNIGETGNGVKWSQQNPPPWEAIQGTGSEQKLKGKIGGAEVVIAAPQAQVKGIVFNNALQGQAKAEIVYVEPRVLTPANCTVEIGKRNTIKVYTHLMWTWNGEAKQLTEQPQKEQKPDLVFLPAELQQGATTLPNELTFTTVILKGASCPATVKGIQAPVKGSVAVALTPEHVGEWSTTQTQEILEGNRKQHFWNGKENIGVETKLTLSGEPAINTGSFKVKTIGVQLFEQQELATFEE